MGAGRAYLGGYPPHDSNVLLTWPGRSRAESIEFLRSICNSECPPSYPYAAAGSSAAVSSRRWSVDAERSAMCSAAFSQ